MGITRTYSSGDKGRVRRLDNLTGPWIAVDPATNLRIPALPGLLRDIETDTVNGDKVYAVGEMAEGNITTTTRFYGIVVSNDAGAIWDQPAQLLGGNYSTLFTVTPLFNFYEVSVVDASNIFVCGDDGWVVKSTDGGQSFNKCTQLPAVTLYGPADGPNPPLAIRPVIALHFITPLVGVVACGGNIFKTIDGGNTWVHLNGGQPIAAGSVTFGGIGVGIFISQDNQTIVCLNYAPGTTSNIVRSTNGGATWTDVFSWVGPGELTGLHLTWTDDLHLWGFSKYFGRIASTDGGATWTYLEIPHTGTPSKNDNAGHFYSNTEGFYAEGDNVYQTVDGGFMTKVLSETAPYVVQALWTRAPQTPCYLLTDCAGIQAPITTSVDMSLYVGQTINACISGPNEAVWPIGCYCVSVELAPDCTGNVQWTGVTTEVFPSCVECVKVCYILSDCEGILPDMLVENDFAAYVGQVVHLKDCVDTCWLVSVSQTCTGAICTNEVFESFVDCVTCLPPVIPIPVADLHPRKIKPGYDTPGCPPEYTEKVNCNFAEAVFDYMAVIRYGITVCCDLDMDEWILKKQILDLKALYDPSLCVCAILKCCPPCDVQAVITVYNNIIPIPCTPPSGITTDILLLCPPPSDVVPNIN